MVLAVAASGFGVDIELAIPVSAGDHKINEASVDVESNVGDAVVDWEGRHSIDVTCDSCPIRRASNVKLKL
jgi:hypothetical protein